MTIPVKTYSSLLEISKELPFIFFDVLKPDSLSQNESVFSRKRD
ncbi:hypothetical protein LEP1GSC082_4332 [Leptospira kirschneri str. H2]|uniref:Uncharacterized protein n=1 Tax=Leptospira kirschneri serovar Bulgarica str. Nikolaevo TaxID=1240687 RepID=M6EVR9_9LEPT|nr:hypothetical protein LEP1GSC082_4332 [Leptospira kirschneri str. H2]EMJ87833.1 hypothetical protein LEP1GSC198_3925 [Leptospira kirschneri str. JB]EMK20215.1 hypothetical protein LEP1GSC008_2003 [Leptospira kirschneri serovar Bulgarica str. Nikolaevo]